MRLSYSYSYGAMGRMAPLQGYLATAGADKVGFSVTGRDAKGARCTSTAGRCGVVERNAMRYYLAIDAYLASLSAPLTNIDRRIQAWFNASERHARQLREMDKATYVTMKRQEYERQQTAM